MLLRLTKHQALGNDFLVVAAPLPIPAAELARRVCDRRRGLGADGLLIIHHDVDNDDGLDARMELINADGSAAEISGNGIRCFAQALIRSEGAVRDLNVLTDAGRREVRVRSTPDPDVLEATVSMGEVRELDEPETWHALGAHPDRPVAHLSVGNPHTVVGVDDVHAVDLEALGRRLHDVNLEIIEPGPEPHAVTMRVHERGVGLTESCGSGACAAAVAARRWGLVPASATSILVHMPGGTAQVNEVDGVVYLTGPTTYVAEVAVEVP